MLTIRFSRVGKKKKPFYRIIISDKRKDPQGNYLELLGHYNPHTKDVVFKADRIQHWIKLGAGISNSVYNLLVSHKVIDSTDKKKSVFISKRRKSELDKKKEEEQKKVEEASAATAPATETSKEETAETSANSEEAK